MTSVMFGCTECYRFRDEQGRAPILTNVNSVSPRMHLGILEDDSWSQK